MFPKQSEKNPFEQLVSKLPKPMSQIDSDMQFLSDVFVLSQQKELILLIAASVHMLLFIVFAPAGITASIEIIMSASCFFISISSFHGLLYRILQLLSTHNIRKTHHDLYVEKGCGNNGKCLI